jgi:hypothetical protein
MTPRGKTDLEGGPAITVTYTDGTVRKFRNLTEWQRIAHILRQLAPARAARDDATKRRGGGRSHGPERM